MHVKSVALAALFAVASASPASIHRRAGPSGTLITPVDGTTWDNTGGFGYGHVAYVGVQNAPISGAGDITSVTTHSIDIYLEAQDGSGTTYYLAKGIAPNDITVDENFQIPIGYGGPLGSYRLIIVETQEGQTPGPPQAITFRSAAPLINIVAGPIP